MRRPGGAPDRGHLSEGVPDLEACRDLGYTLSGLGKREEAIGCYSRALRIDPHCKRAQDALGTLEVKQDVK